MKKSIAIRYYASLLLVAALLFGTWFFASRALYDGLKNEWLSSWNSQETSAAVISAYSSEQDDAIIGVTRYYLAYRFTDERGMEFKHEDSVDFVTWQRAVIRGAIPVTYNSENPAYNHVSGFNNFLWSFWHLIFLNACILLLASALMRGMRRIHRFGAPTLAPEYKVLFWLVAVFFVLETFDDIGNEVVFQRATETAQARVTRTSLMQATTSPRARPAVQKIVHYRFETRGKTWEGLNLLPRGKGLHYRTSMPIEVQYATNDPFINWTPEARQRSIAPEITTFLFTWLLLIPAGFYIRGKHARLRRIGVPEHAIVSHIAQIETRYGTGYVAHYSFKPKKGLEVYGSVGLTYKMQEHVTAGDAIPVLYDPENPEIKMIAWHQWQKEKEF